MTYYDIEATAKRIRELRISHGYSQERLAELLSVDRRHIARLENGARGCSVDLLLQMSELFAVSVDYLLTGKQLQNVILKKKLEAVAKELLEINQSI